MEDKITLRPVRADDQTFIFNVFTDTRAARFETAQLAPQQLQQILEMQFRAQQLQYRAQYPDADFSLILLDESPIGYFYVDRQKERFVLIDIALLPAQLGTGIGTSLVSALIAEAFGEGKPVTAHVDKSNSKALRLWQRLGFQVIADQGVYLEIECRPATPSRP